MLRSSRPSVTQELEPVTVHGYCNRLQQLCHCGCSKQLSCRGVWGHGWRRLLYQPPHDQTGQYSAENCCQCLSFNTASLPPLVLPRRPLDAESSAPALLHLSGSGDSKCFGSADGGVGSSSCSLVAAVRLVPHISVAPRGVDEDCFLCRSFFSQWRPTSQPAAAVCVTA